MYENERNTILAGGGGGEGAEFQQTNYQSSHAPGFHQGGRDVKALN